MTASPTKVNGTARHDVLVLGPVWPITPTDPTTPEPETPTPTPLVDPIAEAEAEAIRAKAWADAEAARIDAEAKAKAIETKAGEEAERQRLANERQRMALEEKQAAHARRLAEIKAEQEEIDRRAAAARKKADDEASAAAEEQRKQQQVEAAMAKEQAVADARWRRYALGFYIVCAVVALPVQIAAFWNPTAPWLVIAPLMLEGGAAVVLKGAAAAVASHRPHWHYRLIAWLLAFIAAGVNLWHGLNAFDPATAIGTAFASVAGPGVWDLHEHGRIRKRDGVLTRRERRAKRATERRDAAAKAAAERAVRAEKEAAEKATAEAAEVLAKGREAKFKDVWEHAEALAAALGETTVSQSTWERAWFDKKGAKPGEDLDVVRERQRAVKRMAEATGEAPTSTRSKVTNAQGASHLPPSPNKRRYSPPATPGVRRKGDAPKFVNAARKQAAITAKQATANPSKES